MRLLYILSCLVTRGGVGAGGGGGGTPEPSPSIARIIAWIAGGGAILAGGAGVTALLTDDNGDLYATAEQTTNAVQLSNVADDGTGSAKLVIQIDTSPDVDYLFTIGGTTSVAVVDNSDAQYTQSLQAPRVVIDREGLTATQIATEIAGISGAEDLVLGNLNIAANGDEVTFTAPANATGSLILFEQSREIVAVTGVQVWRSSGVYSIGQKVTNDGYIYTSLTSGNTGNEPSTDDGTNWTAYTRDNAIKKENTLSGLVFSANAPRPIVQPGNTQIVFQPFTVYYIVPADTSNASPNVVQFSETTFTIPTNSPAPTLYYIIANANGTITAALTPPAYEQLATQVCLGSYIEQGGEIFESLQTGNADFVYSPYLTQIGSTAPFRFLGRESQGGDISVATNDTLDVSALLLIQEGVGLDVFSRPVNLTSSYTKTFAEESPLSFAYVDGLNGYISQPTTTIIGDDATNWSVPIANNNHGIQIIFKTLDGTDIILTPQVEYITVDDAVSSAFGYDPDVTLIPSNALPYAALVVEGSNVNFNDPTNSIIIAVPPKVAAKFGGASIAGGGSSLVQTPGFNVLNNGSQLGAPFDKNQINYTQGLLATAGAAAGVFDVANTIIWVSADDGGEYGVNDIVFFGGGIYVNVSGSNSSLTPDNDVANWKVYGQAGFAPGGIVFGDSGGTLVNEPDFSYDFISQEVTAPSLEVLGRLTVGTTTGSSSAKLDIVSTVQGLGLPSMSEAQRNNISSPRAGLAIYNNTLGEIDVYNGTTWSADVQQANATFVGAWGGTMVFSKKNGLVNVQVNIQSSAGTSSNQQVATFPTSFAPPSGAVDVMVIQENTSSTNKVLVITVQNNGQVFFYRTNDTEGVGAGRALRGNASWYAQ